MAFIKREDTSNFMVDNEVYNSFPNQNPRNENTNYHTSLAPNLSSLANISSYSMSSLPLSSQEFSNRDPGISEYGGRSNTFPFPLPIKTEIDDGVQWMQGEGDNSQSRNDMPSQDVQNVYNHPLFSQNLQSTANFPQMLSFDFYGRHQALANSFLSSYSQANNSMSNYLRPNQDQVTNKGYTNELTFNNRRKEIQNQFLKNISAVPFLDGNSRLPNNPIPLNSQTVLYETTEGNMQKNDNIIAKDNKGDKIDYQILKIEFDNGVESSPESSQIQGNGNFYSGETCNDERKTMNGKIQYSEGKSNGEFHFDNKPLYQQGKIPFSDIKMNGDAHFGGMNSKAPCQQNDCVKSENMVSKTNGEFNFHGVDNKLSYQTNDKAETVSGNIDNEPGKGKYNCEGCPYTCQSPAILKIHLRTHSGEKPYFCTFCDYKSGQKNNVAKHMMGCHIKEKPFRCQYCEYRCAQKNNLVVHERTHTGEKPFVCTFCEYKTVQKPNLVKHMYLHTNEKPYSCEFCDYRCVQKTNLMKHKQKHSTEKLFYECDDCDYKSTQKSNLNKHKLLHDKQKCFNCEICSFKCLQKSNLDRHRLTKHGLSANLESGPSVAPSFVENERIPVELNTIETQTDNAEPRSDFGTCEEVS